MKIISSAILAGVVALGVAGCGAAAPAAPAMEQIDERCHKESQLVPEWICTESIEGAEYAAVGIGTSKNPSMKKKQAITRARAGLAHSIETTVKSKMEDFMRSTGNGDKETIDSVSSSVTKQTAKVTLSGSRKVKEWEMKSGTLYVLVAVSKEAANDINKKVQETIKSSKANDDALWQQFQSKQALDALDKEFPTE